MRKEVLYTNDLTQREKDTLLSMLKDGKAVQVGSNCIGHTRAQMVKNQAQAFFKEVGAVPVEMDMWGGFYALPEAIVKGGLIAEYYIIMLSDWDGNKYYVLGGEGGYPCISKGFTPHYLYPTQVSAEEDYKVFCKFNLIDAKQYNLSTLKVIPVAIWAG